MYDIQKSSTEPLAAAQLGGVRLRFNNGGNQNNGPPKKYVIQPGDTLTGIAEDTGVSIERIQQLNPGLDPQILSSGDTIRLR